ncbi:MAG: TRAP transporter large permease subunit [Pseudomonadota bacterium]|nr:C4-dicarboxylate ABC transporter permease [Gammaproteobacteria bacterium]MEE2683680.1 TRAP transporter large permease subunit [Pseudomonadota bacterium]|tara:strand:- start:3007 stop:4290 length:1284 start_codon:yes stop_codon:yes gene_type:complete
MSAIFLLIILFLGLAIGVPVAISLGIASISTMLIFTDQSLLSVSQKFFHTMQVYPLLAVPFFILAATFMTTGGVARRMIDFANALVGHYRGGLAMASLLACAFFSAVSGSAPATVVAVGSVMIAGMIRSGYSEKFAAGVICNAGTLGILIPPSLVMVIYGAVTESSIGNLFIAGLLPGIFLTIVMITTVAVIARKQNLPRQKKVSLKDTVKRGLDAFWGLLLLFIILGGIYSGIFTPTEAAAVSAVYAFFIAVFIYKDIKLTEVPKVLTDSAKVTVMLMFIIANAYVFANVLTTEQIPQVASEWIISLGLPAWGFLIVLNILLLAAGNFMEPTSVVLILTPIVYPIALELGIDPIHLGIIMVLNMQMGLVTPPVGLNLFVTAGVANMSMEKVIQASLPWLIVLLGVLIVITYVPIISLIVPTLLGLV